MQQHSLSQDHRRIGHPSFRHGPWSSTTIGPFDRECLRQPLPLSCGESLPRFHDRPCFQSPFPFDIVDRRLTVNFTCDSGIHPQKGPPKYDLFLLTCQTWRSVVVLVVGDVERSPCVLRLLPIAVNLSCGSCRSLLTTLGCFAG